MNLARHDLGLSKIRDALPHEGDVSRDLLALRQCGTRPRGRCLAWTFPWCDTWAAELRRLFAALCGGQAEPSRARDYDDLLLYWAQMARRPGARRRPRGAFRPRAGRRVPGHEPPAGLEPAGHQADRPRTDGRRRRCPIDLFVQGCDGPQHPRTFPGLFKSLRPRSSRSTAIIARRPDILAAANAVIGPRGGAGLPRRCGCERIGGRRAQNLVAVAGLRGATRRASSSSACSRGRARAV